MEYVYRALVAAQYTGSQSVADVQQACDQITQLTGNVWTVLSDDGETLILRETNSNGLWANWSVQKNWVVVIDPSVGIVDRLPVSTFLLRYHRETAVADRALVRGLNTPAWITALAAKLGLPAILPK